MKTSTFVLVVLCAVLVLSSHAGEVYPSVEVAGQTFTHCTIDPSNPAEAVIWFDGGGTRVKMADLPSAIQHDLHYSASAAEQFQAAQSEKQQALAEQITERQFAASESWKASHCRIINGELVNTSSLATFSGKVVSMKGPDPILQTYTTNNNYEQVYLPVEGNGSIGAYRGPSATSGWTKHLVSSETVPSRRYQVKNAPPCYIGQPLSIRALQTRSVSTGAPILDCGLPYTIRPYTRRTTPQSSSTTNHFQSSR